MEIARHWRMQRQRYRLEGQKRVREDGVVEVSLTGEHWVESQNGFNRQENPTEGKIIYQAPLSQSENDNKSVPEKVK